MSHCYVCFDLFVEGPHKADTSMKSGWPAKIAATRPPKETGTSAPPRCAMQGALIGFSILEPIGLAKLGDVSIQKEGGGKGGTYVSIVLSKKKRIKNCCGLGALK